ncbi:hypothetical protein TEA_004029 [Camellia sinensis var. sinensis]|uniref:Uncharacterized protein n=1 Tax=Camellia sinensis var. sinensis TaxID=542762 RepID=A0A4S4DSU4_CAMSN|nr:hypothetical protein TEA_004029 [Camellia sinensis var. sinensis]
MPPCPSRGGGRRGGTSFGTSSSSRGDTDSTLRTALLSGLKLFGEKYDFELLAKRDECERLVRLYKECKIDRLINCDFYLGLRKVKPLVQLILSFIFLVTTKDSTLRTALLSGLKLFGEKYDFELLAKRDECERLVRLYKQPYEAWARLLRLRIKARRVSDIDMRLTRSRHVSDTPSDVASFFYFLFFISDTSRHFIDTFEICLKLFPEKGERGERVVPESKLHSLGSENCLRRDPSVTLG